MSNFHILLFLCFLAFSYSWFQQRPDIPWKTQRKIHQDMRNILNQAVKIAAPTAEEIEILRLSNNIKDAKNMEANFTIKFLQPDDLKAKIEMQGVAKLSLIDEVEDSWSIDEIQMGDDTIEFQEALKIEISRPDANNEL